MIKKLSEKLFYLLLGTSFIGAVHAMDDSIESEYVRMARELNMSVGELEQLLQAQLTFDLQKEEKTSSKETKKVLPHEIAIPVKPRIKKEEYTINDVLAGALIHHETHEGKWVDESMKEGIELFKSLSLEQLKSREVLSWVMEQGSDAVYRQYQDAIAELRSDDALHQLMLFKEIEPKVRTKEIGRDLYYTIGQEGLYADTILVKENSSGKDNNCLLYSMIRSDLGILTKILGDELQARKILSIPEKANSAEGERRDFKPVREKFFKDITANLDVAYLKLDGKAMTIRQFLDHVIKDTNRLYNCKIKNAESLLATLNHYDLMLDHDFSVIFSLIYEIPVQVLIPAHKNGYQLIPQTPNLFVMPEGKTRFVYHSGLHGAHFQKLLAGQTRIK